MKKQILFIELLIIFFAPPWLVISGILPKLAIMPVLWGLTFYAFLVLRGSKVKLFTLDFDKEAFAYIIKRYLFITAAMTSFVLLYQPDIFLALLRDNPLFWLEVMIFYPIFSAYLQEILFRAFFFYRYKRLFNKNALVLIFLNASIFAYVHIVFENWIAVLFTFIGGLLFAHTYLKTQSTLLTAIEHALYGNTLYTIGLGYYFYHGANIG